MDRLTDDASSVVWCLNGNLSYFLRFVLNIKLEHVYHFYYKMEKYYSMMFVVFFGV